eukprot:TRINITY_DN1673_c0_g2_i1.p1 TRINITY_DN1673_c0_g2~~TRINITY_DN1673_c0_g2_i1.p1  ORF type:complete len:647 (-),score=51.29 TRINITY_DN1673_c0_g2_i1:1068-2855(-)
MNGSFLPLGSCSCSSDDLGLQSLFDNARPSDQPSQERKSSEQPLKQVEKEKLSPDDHNQLNVQTRVPLFDNPEFSDIVMNRIITERKVQYTDNCTLRTLNKQMGDLATQRLMCAIPRNFNDRQEIRKFGKVFGKYITELCLCGVKDLQEGVMTLIPRQFPRVKIVKISQTKHDNNPRDWKDQDIIKMLRKCYTKIKEAILVITDMVIVYENDGYINWWKDTLREFINDIKRKWRGVTFTFEFFTLQSVMAILQMMEEFNVEESFTVRVSVVAQDYYQLLGSENLQPISDEEFDEIYDFLSSTPVLSSLVIKPNLLSKGKVEDPKFLRMMNALKDIPCSSTIVNYSFSGYSWTEIDREEFQQFEKQTHNDVFGTKLVVQAQLRGHYSNFDTEELLEQQFGNRLDSFYLNTQIRNYKKLTESCNLQFSKLKHLQLVLHYGQTAQLISQVQGIRKLDKLQILSIISYDYQMTEQLLNQLLDMFKETLPSLEAFYFYHNITSKIEKQASEISFPHLALMRDIAYIDIITPSWKINYDKLYTNIRNLRYLRGVRVQSDVTVKEPGCDEQQLKYLKTVKKLQYQSKVKQLIPRMRQVVFFT